MSAVGTYDIKTGYPVVLVDVPQKTDHNATNPTTDGVELINGASITPEAINWLWDGWLAAGKFHIMAGPPGTGKTTVCIALAATITSGGRWPDGTRADIGNVLIWSGEDDPKDTLVPRLIAMGADMGKVYFVGDVHGEHGRRAFDPSSDMDSLIRQANKIGSVRLLIVDPVVSSVAGDSHKNAEVRRGLAPLVELGSMLRCAVIGITHFSKSTAGRDPVERVTGSIAFGALARVVMGAIKLPEADGGGRLIVRAKSNIGPDGGGFKYDLQQTELNAYHGIYASEVLWGGPVEGEARELLGQAEKSQDDSEEGAKSEAGDWLQESLKNGDIDGKRIKTMARDAGISERTLYRAAKNIGVKMFSGGFSKPRIWHMCAMHAKECHVCLTNLQGTDGKTRHTWQTNEKPDIQKSPDTRSDSPNNAEVF